MKRQVLYINWDGFASYYYRLASSRGLVPVIDGLKGEGVFFTNAWCGVPAITNPMQTAISSGAYSGQTGNVKLYYDREQGQVLDQRRENAAENIADALYRQGNTVASVHHFTFEENGTYAGNTERPYVFVEDSTYTTRFKELLRLYAGDTVFTGGQRLEVVKEPDFAAIYFDDLDTVGHNNGKLAPVAATEQQRIENVLWRLNQMDSALGKLIEGLKQLGIYDGMSIFLITDHGMTPFTFDQRAAEAYQDLLATLEAAGYSCEVLKGGEAPKAGTDIVLASAGLSLLLTFTAVPPDGAVRGLRQILEKKQYVGKMMDAAELKKEGSMEFCDLYISPKPPYIFKEKAPAVGATHDSLDDSARSIFSLVWGSGIAKGVVVDRRVMNIDFAPTMAKLLGAAPPRNCEGRCIQEALAAE